MLGLLYDVHGNLPALDAVLADADAGDVDRWLLGGDYTLFGAWPAETLARLRALDGAEWLRGNGERWTATPGEAPEQAQEAIEACREALGEDDVAALDRLAAQTLIDGALACHGSPISDVRSFLPEPADDEDELLAGVSATRLIFGHTHLAFRRVTEHGIELVNPGSVGMPFDGDPRAAYAVVRADGAIEHRRVGYDHGASAAAVRERFGAAAWTATVATRIERARF